MKSNEFINEDGSTGASVAGGVSGFATPIGTVVRRVPRKKKKRVEEAQGQLDWAVRRHMIKRLAWESDLSVVELQQLNEQALIDMFTEYAPDDARVFPQIEPQGLRSRMQEAHVEPAVEPKAKPTGPKLMDWLDRIEDSQPKVLAEAPINFDRDEPTNPDIYGHKANPADLNTRRLRALSQLKDMAKRAESAQEFDSLLMWKSIVANFPELAMNIGEIDHAIQELEKIRRKGGVNSRGLPDLS
jgi:hypothetical protein